MIGLFCLDYDVVDVRFYCPAYELVKTLKHTSLEGSPRVFQPERHRDVTVGAEWGDERGRELVGLFHRDLMITGVRIKKAKRLTSRGGVDYLVYAW